MAGFVAAYPCALSAVLALQPPSPAFVVLVMAAADVRLAASTYLHHSTPVSLPSVQMLTHPTNTTPAGQAGSCCCTQPAAAGGAAPPAAVAAAPGPQQQRGGAWWGALLEQHRQRGQLPGGYECCCQGGGSDGAVRKGGRYCSGDGCGDRGSVCSPWHDAPNGTYTSPAVDTY